MWRKFNRSKDPTIGSPTLIETTFDQQYLDAIPEVDSRRNVPNYGKMPSLPKLPFKAVEPLVQPHRILTNDRASSVLSQQNSDSLRVVPRGSEQTLAAYPEVSPLTSPRASAEYDQRQSPDISPIDPRPPPLRVLPKSNPKPPPTQLPIRKVAPTTHPASPSSPASPSLTPAPENVESGQHISSTPNSRDERLTALKNKNRKLLSGFREQRPSGKSEAKGRSPHQESLEHPVHREPWKGASGRTALVEPVRNIPRSRNDLRPDPQKRHGGEASTDFPNVAASAENSNLTARPVASATSSKPFEPVDTAQQQMKPIAPLKIGNSAPPVNSAMTAENLSGPFNPRYSDATTSSYEHTRSEVQEGSDSHAQTHPASLTSHQPSTAPGVPDHQIPASGERELASHFSWTTYARTASPPPQTPENEPSSHFSWTTYSDSVNESPRSAPRRDTSAPPVPPLPYMPNASAMRTRAKAPHSVDLKSTPLPNINRKPTPSDFSDKRPSSLSAAAAGPIGGRKSPTAPEVPLADKSKSLPQCPPEVEAKDRIAALEARMDDLTRRRRNITQILLELKEVVRPTNFAYDLAMRKEGKRTVKSLEDELSEIRVEEHQVGMTLHRALKKRDQENIYGYPTGLWVKRVTS